VDLAKSLARCKKDLDQAKVDLDYAGWDLEEAQSERDRMGAMMISLALAEKLGQLTRYDYDAKGCVADGTGTTEALYRLIDGDYVVFGVGMGESGDGSA